MVNNQAIIEPIAAYANPYADFQKKLLTYDFESANNIWSYVAYNADDNEVLIYYHHREGVYVSREDIIHHALHDNEDTYKSYFDNPPTIKCIPETPQNFLNMFSDPKRYRVGFNSDYYDLLIIAFIIAFIKQHNTLPTPEAVRNINDLIINPRPLMQRNSYFSNLAREKGVRMNNKGKYTQRDIFTLVMDVVPTFGQIYYLLKNTGMYVDIKLLNEKDKEDSASDSVSLKRIAAQLGFRIVEPENVDLSDSYKQLTTTEITTLLIYNVSDVIVSYLVFMTKDYQNVLKTREQLLERFKTRYKTILTVNSTSAQFITNTIAPTPADKIIDNPFIETFFPVNGPQFADIVDTIEPYYTALKERNYTWLRNAPLLAHLSEEHFQYLETTRNLSAVEALDSVFNNYIASSTKYGPSKSGVPRYRIRYGTLERDLLEYMHERYEKFPSVVYELYSCYRGATSRAEGVRRYMERHPLPPDNVTYTVKGPKGNKIAFDPQKHTHEDVSSISSVVVIAGTRMVLSFSIGGVHGEVIDAEAYERDCNVVNVYNKRLDTWKTIFPNPLDLFKLATTGELRNVSSQYLTVDLVPTEVLTGTDDDLLKYVKLFMTVKSSANKTLINSAFSGNEADYEKLKTLVTYKANKKAIDPKDYKVTVDLENVLHADVDSLYPSLLILLRVFAVFNNETFEWEDLYKTLRDERIEKKKFANRIPEEEWGPEEILAEAIQLLNKLLLNSASGVLDASYDTNVRANNKAMSMRLCGQLILTDVVFAAEEKGGESVSTNTDGVYLDKIDMETIVPIIDEWKILYGIGADPEIMARFVSKDSNNRLEQKKKDSFGRAAGGTIGNAGGASSSKKMKQPSIVDETVVAYFKAHHRVDRKYEEGYDTEWIRNYITEKLTRILDAREYNDNVRSDMLSFMWSKQPSKGINFGLMNNDGIREIQNVNRIVLVNDGATLVAMSPKPISSNGTLDSDYKLYHALSYYVSTVISDQDRMTLFNEVGLQYSSITRDYDIAQLLNNLPSAYIATNPIFKDFIVENIKSLDTSLSNHGITKMRKKKGITVEMINDDLYNQYLDSPEALIAVINSLDKLSRQSKLNLFGWKTNRLDIEELTFMKESKVTDYQPDWVVDICNEDVSHYFQKDVWNNINVDSYVEFVEAVLDVWSIDHVDMAKGLQGLQVKLGLAA